VLQIFHESFDLMRTRLQRRCGDGHFVSPTMKHQLPVALTSGLANRRVIQHAICPARRVIGTVNLSDRWRQVCERRVSNGDGRHSISREQISGELAECVFRTCGNRPPDPVQQLFGLGVTESQRLVVIRLAGNAVLDKAYASSVDDGWCTVRYRG